MGLERVLTSLRPLGLGVRPLHCSAAGFADLHNSLSDGFYEVGKGGSKADVSGDRPLSRDPEVRSARLASSLGEPSYLANSLSEGTYEYKRPLPRHMYTSMTDPMDFFLQNSLSGESNYQMPSALQTRRAGFSTSRLRPTMQRIVVRTSIHDAEPLGNSYSDAEYPRPRASKKD
ncbi:hypothetical protein QBZ16_004245 [Prototheca wickerhamii]|uniref:Uncharacterized protein n=1 Tax=Prototheca wickerhamii TaxID=3111 RepID=A0AAD9MK25_PROWI|nr:hypothetical protein QBZ16_004245 [Prototheca wickerhamii]